ncbi:hypothetical protein Q7P35_000986 [Cladosporium inversicolor]
MAAAKIKLAALGTSIYYIATKLGSSGPLNESSPYPPTQHYRARHEDGYSQINAGLSPDMSRSTVPSQHQGEG